MSIMDQLEVIRLLEEALSEPLPTCKCGATCWFCKPFHRSHLSKDA